MSARKKWSIAGLVVGSFIGFVVLINYLAARDILTSTEAGLMVVALFGMYVGYGILIIAYRIMNRLR